MSRGLSDEAFERLYTEHAAGLLGFLTYQTGDRALAEDIVADTFERVLTTRSGWRGQSGEKTWLYAIAMNRLRDLARRRGAEARAVDRVAAVPAAAGRTRRRRRPRPPAARPADALGGGARGGGAALRSRSVAGRDRRAPRRAPEHDRGAALPGAAPPARRHVLDAKKISLRQSRIGPLVRLMVDERARRASSRRISATSPSGCPRPAPRRAGSSWISSINGCTHVSSGASARGGSGALPARCG